MNDPRLPVIGQPIKVFGCTIIGNAQCQCGHTQPLPLLALISDYGLARIHQTCLGCGTIYAIESVGIDATGSVVFNVSSHPQVMMNPEPES